MLSTVSNVRGSDPSFFAAVAAPANFLWFGGWIGLAVGAAYCLVLGRTLAAGSSAPIPAFLIPAR